DGNVQPAAGAAAGHLPRFAHGLPQRGVDDEGVVRVETDVDGAGLGVFLEHLLPVLAAVPGAVDAALRVGSEGMAQDGGEGDVRVARMHNHLGDLALLLPDVLPVLAAVGRFVDAVADGDVAADVGLAGADVDDVGVGGRDGDAAD